MNKKLVNILASSGLIFTALIWGFAFVVVKDSLNTIPPVYMVAIRYTIAAVVLAFFLIPKFKLLNKNYLKHGLITGAMLATAYITQTIGCNFTTAGKNAFLTTIYVILIPLISWPIYKKRPKPVIFVCALLALIGIGMLSLKAEDGRLLNMNIGDVLTLICGFFFACHIVLTALFCKDENPVLITWLQFVVTAIISWIFAPMTEGALSVAVFKNSNVIISMLYLGIFSSLIGFVLQNVGLKYMESSLASLFLSLESVFGVLCSVIFLHERLTTIMIIGCVLIFVAITVAEQYHSKDE